MKFNLFGILVLIFTLFPIIVLATTPNLILGSTILIQPASAPTSSPSPSPAPTTSSQYPLYSSYFVKTNNPFFISYDTLKTMSGQVTQPSNASTLSNNFWNQGYYTQTVAAIPFYVSSSSYPTYNIKCYYATYNYTCPSNNTLVHLPNGYQIQTGSDHHISVSDPVDGYEVDNWGGDQTNNCQLSGNNLLCSVTAKFNYNSKGLQGTECGVAGCYAEGLFEITAGDLLQSGPINHALGIQGACLDNDTSQGTAGAVYPSSRTTGTDNPCAAQSRPQGPPYGAMWHLKDSVNINNLGYGTYCKKIVQAMQTYGMYTYDSGNGGLQLEMENDISYQSAPYNGNNPWTNIIFPEMIADGDASGSPAVNQTGFNNCLNRVSASDFEIYYDPNLGF